MKTICVLPMFLIAAATLADEPKKIGPVYKTGNKETFKLKVGDKGELSFVTYKVVEIRKNNSLVMKVRDSSFSFITRGFDTTGLKVGDWLFPVGEFEIVEPEQVGVEKLHVAIAGKNARFETADGPKKKAPPIIKWEIGSVGQFDFRERFVIVKILSETELYLMEKQGDRLFFILSGVSTKGFADDQSMSLTGKYKVTETKKFQGKTIFIVQPIKD